MEREREGDAPKPEFPPVMRNTLRDWSGTSSTDHAGGGGGK